jgi:hypothetical protein
VEAAAHQIRMRFCLARVASSAGMMKFWKCSNGSLSRKKKDSFVVIASTTSAISFSASRPRSFCTSSVKLGSAALRASGSSRLSNRYCLSADSVKPERSFSSLRRKS